MSVEIDDVEDALRRADELAELTGRTKKDVVADLLDDGQLNYSAGEDANKSDLLDVAQEKAEKLKSLIITMIPIIALVLGGGGLEMLGATDFTGLGGSGGEDDEPWTQPPPAPVWGCTDPSADNYDEWADTDDGSCEYEPEPVYGCTNDAAPNYDPDATEDDGSCECADGDADGVCDQDEVDGCTDEEAENYDDEATDDDGSCTYPEPEPEPEQDCSAEVHNHYRGHAQDDAEQDAIVVAFRVVPDDCDELDLEIRVDLFQQGYGPNYTWNTWESGENEHQVEHVFDGVDPGHWIPKIKVLHDDEVLADVNFWSIEVEEPEPTQQNCSFTFYEAYGSWSDNNTNLSVIWDLDSDCEDEQPIEVDIVVKQNGTMVASHYIDYNTTYTDIDYKHVKFLNQNNTLEHEVCLTVWYQYEGEWMKKAEVTFTVPIAS